MTARITGLQIEGFRVIDKLNLELQPMNVLIGENGSGKSTVIEALELLRKAAALSGESFFSELYTLHGGVQMFRGTTQAATRQVKLGATVEFPNDGRYQYQLVLQVELSGAIRLVRELLSYGPGPGHTEPLRIVDRTPGNAQVFHRKAKRLERFEVGEQDLLLTTLATDSDDGVDPKVPNQAVPKLRDFLRNIRVYPPTETNPAWARLPGEPLAGLRSPVVIRPAASVDRGGSNLPNVYQRLRNRGDAPWKQTLMTLRLGLGSDLEDLVIEPMSSGGSISLALKMRGVGVVPAFALSDGQLAFLMFVGIMEIDEIDAQRGGLVALDEPDTHFHPALIGRIVSLAEEASERRTVVIATHSDRLLDALSNPVESVILFERVEGSRCEARRPNREQLERWLTRYAGLGAARADGYSSVIFTEKVGADQ
ncbi:MAG: AAA family ATPase [Myxococcales bacterium]|nr:AAA family ATPase [Myxococcales bacterium]